MSNEEQFEKFRVAAVDVLKVDPAKVTMEARFGEDLDADSLDLVELIMRLEDDFGVEIPESELDDVDTVGKAYNLVTSKL